MPSSLAARPHLPSQHASTLRRAVAALCVLLLLIGVAQFTHAHAAGDPAEAGCSLCVVAHLAPLPSDFVLLPAVAEQLQLLLAADPANGPPQIITASLYIRPPPVLTPHA